MSPFRAPANHDVVVTGREHLFDVKVEIGESRDIGFEELPSTFVAMMLSQRFSCPRKHQKQVWQGAL